MVKEMGPRVLGRSAAPFTTDIVTDVSSPHLESLLAGGGRFDMLNEAGTAIPQRRAAERAEVGIIPFWRIGRWVRIRIRRHTASYAHRG